MSADRALRIGIGGPVGSGKSSLIAALCRELAGEVALGVVTNDIYTTEDAEFLRSTGVLAASGSSRCRPAAARTPRSATTSRSTSKPSRSSSATGPLELVLVESGGDNLTAVFSPALADVQIFVIDVAGGDDIPRKGGPGDRARGPARHQQDRPRAVRRLRRRADARRRARAPRRAAGARAVARVAAARARPSRPGSATQLAAFAAARAPALERDRRARPAPRPSSRARLAHPRAGASPSWRSSARRRPRDRRAAARHAGRAADPRPRRDRRARGVRARRRRARSPATATARGSSSAPGRRWSSSPSPRRSRCPARRGRVLRLDVTVGEGGRLVLDEGPLIVAAGATSCARCTIELRAARSRRCARPWSSAATASRPARSTARCARALAGRPLLHDGLRLGAGDAHVALRPATASPARSRCSAHARAARSGRPQTRFGGERGRGAGPRSPPSGSAGEG